MVHTYEASNSLLDAFDRRYLFFNEELWDQLVQGTDDLLKFKLNTLLKIVLLLLLFSLYVLTHEISHTETKTCNCLSNIFFGSNALYLVFEILHRALIALVTQSKHGQTRHLSPVEFVILPEGQTAPYLVLHL